jgi:hypothetical protein
MMTRSIRTLALCVLALAVPAAAPAADLRDSHIRSTEAELIAALADGARLSPTLQSLIDRLEASDVIVYLTFDRSPSPGLAGHLSLLAAVPGRRYLRVAIDRRNVGCQRIAILGHELQHAVEIAESPSVTSDATVVALYRRIGFRSRETRVDCFDSLGAILAGQIVKKEVLGAARAAETR